MQLAQMLQQKGYRTGVFGKWHVGLTWFDKDGKKLGGGFKNSLLIDYEKSTPLLQPPPAEPGAHLKPLSSADGIGAIVAQPGQTSRPAKAEMQPQLGPDYDDEEEVPPLL